MSDPVIGIIGSGNIGSAVARLAAGAGLTVVLSNSRGPQSLEATVADLGPTVRAATPAQAAQAGDLVVLAVPLAVYPDLPGDVLEGRVVIDAANYLPAFSGPLPAVEASGLPSSAYVQRMWPAARVVKALNNVDFLRLSRLAGAEPQRCALPVFGDHRAATATVVDFLARIGFDGIDQGALADSWRSEPGSPIYVTPYSRDAEPVPSDPYTRFLEAIPVPLPAREARALVVSASRP